jgi:hypothetical protein
LLENVKKFAMNMLSDMQERDEAAGNIITRSQSPQAFAAYMVSENKKWAEIIRLTGITAE